jgi:hypothetical protein
VAGCFRRALQDFLSLKVVEFDRVLQILMAEYEKFETIYIPNYLLEVEKMVRLLGQYKETMETSKQHNMPEQLFS